ncbi:MAG: glycosyltransferase family 25 protein [Odoribacter sp.]|nr:glycosyltransferase family 25 protein [Odoribacter sp.]
MRAYVVNLEKDSDRRADMRGKMAETPYSDFSFVKGVYGKGLSEHECEEYFDLARFKEEFGYRPFLGEIGCAASHYGIWTDIARCGRPAMIFEDDIYFDGGWNGIPSFLESWLDSPRPRVMLLTHFFMYYRGSVIDHGNGIVSVNTVNAFGTVCYAINAAAAQLLVDLGKPHYVADAWDYFKTKGLEVRGLLQHPVYVNYDYRSNIDSRGPDPDRLLDYIGYIPGVNTVTQVYRKLYIIIASKLGILHIWHHQPGPTVKKT